MAISNASRLANFGTGIGTQGAALKIDNTNDRVGIGTTNPQQMLQVGTAVSVYGNSGIVSASKYYGDGSNITGIETGLSVNAAGGALQRVLVCNVTAGVANTAATTSSLYWNDNTSTLYATNVNVSGTTTTEDTQNVDSTGIVTAGLGFRATLGGIVVTAGVSTFSSALDINATVDIDGQLDVDELIVAGVSTYSSELDINAGLTANNINVTGVSTFNNTIVGGATTELVVGGDLRVTGILTVGTESITIDGSNNIVNVGAGITLNATTGKIEAPEIVTSGTTGAFYPPVMTTTQRDALTVTEGAMIYNSTDSKVQFYNGSSWIDATGVSLGLGMGVF